MEKEKQEYLDRLCNRINNENTEKYIIIVSKFDDYVKDFLKSVNAEQAENNKFYLRNFNEWYKIVPIEECPKGIKPRKAIIDSRISLKDLWSIVEPRLIYCSYCRYF